MSMFGEIAQSLQGNNSNVNRILSTLVLTGLISASSNNSGTLQVQGGVGITGALYTAASTIDDGSGNIKLPAGATLSALTTGTLNLGNATTSINLAGSTAIFALNGGNVQILNTGGAAGSFQLLNAGGAGTISIANASAANAINLGNNTGPTNFNLFGSFTINVPPSTGTYTILQTTSANADFITFNNSGSTRKGYVGLDGVGLVNADAGALWLGTDSTGNKPIYLSAGNSSTWGLKVSSGAIVNTKMNLLDNGTTGAATFAGVVTLQSTATNATISTGAMVFSGSSLSIGRSTFPLAGNATELNFGQAFANRMICLYDAGSAGADDQNQFFGIGVSSATLRYHVDSGGFHRFYKGTSSSTATQLFQISYTGAITSINSTFDDSNGNMTLVGTGATILALNRSSYATSYNTKIRLAPSNSGGTYWEIGNAVAGGLGTDFYLYGEGVGGGGLVFSAHTDSSLYSAVNTLDSGTGGFTFAPSGSAAGTIGGGTYTGQITIGNTSNNLSPIIQGGTSSNAALTINSTSGGGCYLYVNRSGVSGAAFGTTSSHHVDIYDFAAGASWLYNNGTNGNVTSHSNVLDNGTTGAASFAGLITATSGVSVAGATSEAYTTTAGDGIYSSWLSTTATRKCYIGNSGTNYFTSIPNNQGCLVLSTNTILGVGKPIFLCPGGDTNASTFGLKVATGSVVNTANVTVDDGSGNIYGNSDNTFLSMDAGTNRFGLTKKSGAIGGISSAGTNSIVFSNYSTLTALTSAGISANTPTTLLTLSPTQFLINNQTYHESFKYAPRYSSSYTTTTTIAAHDINKGVVFVPPGTGAITLTWDTGTNLQTEFFAGAAPFNNLSKDFMIVNASSNTITIATNTGITFAVSSTSIPAGRTANFVVTNIGGNSFDVWGGN